MSFELLTTELQKLVAKRFKDPTPPQKLAIPAILSGSNILIISKTGTGKSEAAVLPVLNLMMTEKTKPISALYITPMKSLNRDLLDRFIWWGNQTGMEISVRHGDTSQYERKLQVEFPPNMLVTTLEQLQPMLTGKRLRELLKNVKWIILDEVHEIVDSKRGVQLTLALERLRELCGDFQVIMLSATVDDPESVSKFFSPNKEVKIIKTDTTKEIEIKVIFPETQPKDSEIAKKIFSSKETAARLRTIMDYIKNSRSTLAFSNTRDFAEILASRIRAVDRDFPVAIHHSSLSKEVRINAEKDFKQEKLKSLICTSSLQLGIDIGSVDLVLQYMSPRTVSQLVQRIGRSGHALSKISKGVIIAVEGDDVFESAVIARKALAGELEKNVYHDKPYDVLAHQLIGMTFDFGKVDYEKAYEIVKRAYPYRNLTHEEFMEVCKQLESLGLAFLDTQFKKKRRGFEYYFENLSTIPDIKQYRVHNMLSDSFVGVLDEEFVALHGEPGTTFILKGEAYRIVAVEDRVISVEPIEDMEAAVPGWEGELIPVPYEVATEVGNMREFISNNLKKDSQKELITSLQKKYPVDENAAKEMISIIKNQQKFGVVPTEQKILIEDFENLVVIHSCFGTNVNETLGRFLTALLTTRVGSVALRTDPYRIMIQFQQKNMELVKDILFNTNPEHLQSYLELSLTKSELFGWKFVHVAKRFGAISRHADLGKVKMQRIVDDYVGTPIYKETLKELETEKLDIEKAVKILKKIQDKEIEVVFKRGISPLGKIGVDHKYAEVVGPEKPEVEIFQLFKERIMETKVRLVCTNCGEWEEVFTVKDVKDDLKCRKCGAKTIAILKEQWVGAGKAIKKALAGKQMTEEEKMRYNRATKRADLFLVYNRKAAIALAGRGVGAGTANRILSRYHRTDDDLLRDILNAERQFIKTRKFWAV